MSYRIGCSGWSYSHWRDSFYPHGLRQADWFKHYSSLFDTVEINNSFYRTPTEDTFQDWRRKAPEGFLYSVKVNRAVTQFHKLGARAIPLFEEFVHRAERLETALGPLLLQLPPSLGYDPERLSNFLQQPIVARHPLAIEFRHADWFVDDLYTLLRKHHIALVLSDFKELPVPQVATTHWVYVRLHGTSGHYYGSYGEKGLRDWAVRLKELSSEGYVYFNNDVGAAAPHDALRLRDLLSSQ